MSEATAPQTADFVRARNKELDDALMVAIEQIEPSLLHVDPENGEWTLAQNLAHIGEFPRFFASDLRAWKSDQSRVIGRTHDHDVRLTAVESASERAYGELRDDCARAFAELADALEDFGDEDLDAVTSNVKYGQEPLRAYLARYILGHKEAHIDQLQRTLAVVLQTKQPNR